MRKEYFIFLLFISILLNIFLFSRIRRKNCDFNELKVLEEKTGEKKKLSDFKEKVKLLLLFPEEEECNFGVNEHFIFELENLGEMPQVSFLLIKSPENSQLSFPSFSKKFYIDWKNNIIRTGGYFRPSVYLIGKNGRLLFTSPIPRDQKLRESLLKLLKIILKNYLIVGE